MKLLLLTFINKLVLLFIILLLLMLLIIQLLLPFKEELLGLWRLLLSGELFLTMLN